MHDPAVVGYRVLVEGDLKNSPNFEAVDINMLFELLDRSYIRVDLIEGEWRFINDVDNYISISYPDSETAAVAAGLYYAVIISKEEFEKRSSPSATPAPHAFTINKKSWHYKVIKAFDSSKLWYCNNLCDYTKLLISALIVFTFLGLVATAIGLWWIVGFVWSAAAIAMAAMGTSLDVPSSFWIPFILTICGGAAWGAGRGVSSLRERMADKAPKAPKEPGFIAVAYRNFKEKTCIRIKFD